MKNKHKRMFSAALMFVLSLGALTSCDFFGGGETTKPVTHGARTEYDYDEHQHWHNCTAPNCDEVFDTQDHVFGEETVLKEPTCTETGISESSCICGYKKQTVIDALGHDFGEWETVSEATCTETGLKRRTCSRCDVVEEETLPIINHVLSDYKHDETNHWKECTTCGEKIDNEAHDFGSWEVDKKASCSEVGKKHRTCLTCGYIAYEDIPLEEHRANSKYEINETHHWNVCLDCGAKLNEQPHDFSEWIVTTKPSCSKEGVEQRMCLDCEYIESRPVAKLDHTFGEKYKHDSNQHWKECTKCGAASTKENHTYGEWTIEREPTCEKEGKKVRRCTVCGAMDFEFPPKLQHNYEYVYDENTHREVCTLCGKEKPYSKHGHSFGQEVIVKAPTCSEEGLKTETCLVCGYTIETVIPTSSHQVGDWKHDETNHWQYCSICQQNVNTEPHKGTWVTTKEATCTEPGLKYRICEVCNYREEVVIPAKGHNYVDKYDENGHWQECSRCPLKTEVVPHEMYLTNPDVERADCKVGASKIYKCKHCNYTYSKDYVYHINEFVRVQRIEGKQYDFFNPFSITYYCESCKKTLNTVTIPCVADLLIKYNIPTDHGSFTISKPLSEQIAKDIYADVNQDSVADAYRVAKSIVGSHTFILPKGKFVITNKPFDDGTYKANISFQNLEGTKIVPVTTLSVDPVNNRNNFYYNPAGTNEKNECVYNAYIRNEKIIEAANNSSIFKQYIPLDFPVLPEAERLLGTTPLENTHEELVVKSITPIDWDPDGKICTVIFECPNCHKEWTFYPTRDCIHRGTAYHNAGMIGKIFDETFANDPYVPLHDTLLKEEIARRITEIYDPKYLQNHQ